jgi:hypothetical protein
MRRGGLRRLAAWVGLALALSSGPAWATWYRAETDRFVVYGEGKEARVREYATKLQTFDTVLRLFHPTTRDKTPATKLQLYLVQGSRELRQVRPSLVSGAAGAYWASNEGIIAAVNTEGGLQGDDVLFHEYAHHFMLENFPAAYPAWFVEGFAEYFMTTEIRSDAVRIGGYNVMRVESMQALKWVSWEDLLTKPPSFFKYDDAAAYYAQAWLLTHYLRSDDTRAERLNAALRDVAAGGDAVKAFQTAAGMPVKDFDRTLRTYRKLRIMVLSKVPPPPAMTVTALPAGEGEFLLDHARLLLAPTGAADDDYLAGLRRRAARYPDAPFAQRTLARGEFVMGDVAAGEAIVRAQLAARPDDLETVLLAGTGQMLAGFRDKPKRAERFRAARASLAKAFKLDDRDFRILYAYAVSRSLEPSYPTENDVEVLLKARSLAPSVQELSLRAGEVLIRTGDQASATAVLRPVANNPHGGGAAAYAKRLMEGGKPEQAREDAAKDPSADKPPAPSPAK